MPIVRMPDGTQVRFPDDMPREQIRGMIAQKFPDAGSQIPNSTVTGSFDAIEQQGTPRPAQAAANEAAGLPVNLHGVELSPDAYRRVMAQADQQTEVRGTNPISDASDATMQGLMFGASDEVGAAMQAIPDAVGAAFQGRGFDVGRGYNERLALERELDARRQERNPVASIAGEAVGAVPTSMLAGGGIANALTGGRALIANSLLGAGQGAVYGGLAANEDRVGGAQIGGVLGGVAPSVISAGRGALNLINSTMFKPAANALSGAMRPQANALSQVERRMTDAGVSPQAAMSQLDQAAAAGNDAMVLADVGGSQTQRLMRSANNIGGPGADQIQTTLANRNAAQADRVSAAVRDIMGDPESYYSTIDDLIAKRKADASALYQEAYAQPTDFTVELEQLLQRPTMANALRSAQRMSADEGIQSQQFFARIADDGTVTIERTPSTQELDLVKRGLDDIIEANTETLPNMTRKLNNQGRIAQNLKSALLDEMSGNEAYAAARAAFESETASLNAIEQGRRLINADPEIARRAIASMSEADRELARIGVSKAINDQISRRGDGLDVLKPFFGSTRKREVLRELFPDEQSFNNFAAMMEREVLMRRTSNAMGNSTTAQQLNDMQANFEPGVAENLATGNIRGTASALVRSALARATVPTEQSAAEIARILMTTGQSAEGRQIMQQLTALAERNDAARRNLEAVRRLLAGSRAFVVSRPSNSQNSGPSVPMNALVAAGA